MIANVTLVCPPRAPWRATYRALAFGLRWDSDIPLHRFESSPIDGAPADVVVRRREGAAKARDALLAVNKGLLCIDGVRFDWDREAQFDMVEGRLIEYDPGPEWTGLMPPPVFSTLAALVMAWRGAIPLHGSAVEVEGRAVLICGQAGTGKSTLAAGLISRGARLISDDLSVLDPPETDEPPRLLAGRPTMRLYQSTAAMLDRSVGAEVVKPQTDIKAVVQPPRVAQLSSVPLGAVVILRKDASLVRPETRTSILAAQQFRPMWMHKMPGRNQRIAALHRCSGHIAMAVFAPANARDEAAFHARAAAASTMIRAIMH